MKSLLIALPLLVAGCGLAVTQPSEASPTLERSVVVDAPLSTVAGATPTPVSDEASPESSDLPPVTDTPRPPTPAPMQNDAFATEVAGTATAGAPAPETIGQVLEIPPEPCGALSLSAEGGSPDCSAALLRAGRIEGLEFAALLVFDLRELPTEAELLFATIELTGLDAALSGHEASWRIQAVDLPPNWAPERASFAQLASLRPSDPNLAWRIEAGRFPLGRAEALDIEGPAMDLLRARMGRGRLALRIEAAASFALDGPSLFSWHAAGEQAPRLRVAYLALGQQP